MPSPFVAKILQRLQHTRQSLPDDLHPFTKAIFVLFGIVRLRQKPLNPCGHESEFPRLFAESARDHPVHLERTFIDNLMPVHVAGGKHSGLIRRAGFSRARISPLRRREKRTAYLRSSPLIIRRILSAKTLAPMSGDYRSTLAATALAMRRTVAGARRRVSAHSQTRRTHQPSARRM